VNESLGADPTGVLNPGLQLPVPDALDDIDEGSDGEPTFKPPREGLPPSFRMRHDKHYVEKLMSGPTIAQGAAQAASPRPSVPAAVKPLVDDRRRAADEPQRPSAAAVELIASRLESIVAHGAIPRGHAASTDLVSRVVPGIRPAGAGLHDQARSATPESAVAAGADILVIGRAVTIRARQMEPMRRSVTAGEIAAAVRSACTRVARLNGVDCLVTTDDAGFAIAAERALVVHGIAGTVDALLDLMQTQAADDSVDEGGRITVSLHSTNVRPTLIVDVECPTLAWRATPADRFFDNNDQDFAVAPAAGILLASAAHVARLHGGGVGVQLRGGVSLRYVFPREAPRATAAS
jgi:hypothetical protein